MTKKLKILFLLLFSFPIKNKIRIQKLLQSSAGIITPTETLSFFIIIIIKSATDANGKPATSSQC